MKSQPNSEQVLAVRDTRIEPWRDPEWQRLWLSLQSRPWSSLAIVPASAGAPADFALRIAVTLSMTGMTHLGHPIQVADAAKVPLSHLASFLDEIRRCVDAGDRILVAVAPAVESPVSVSIAQTTDASLLCVLLERMNSGQLKRTVSEIGANRFIGSAMFRADSPLAAVSDGKPVR